MTTALSCSGVGGDSVHFFGLAHFECQINDRADYAFVNNTFKHEKSHEIRDNVDAERDQVEFSEVFTHQE